MKKYSLAFILLFLIIEVYTQEIITIDSCYKMARKNYPLIKQKILIDDYEAEQLNKLRKNFYPSIDVNAQIKHQSDVIDISIQPPGIADPMVIMGVQNSFQVTADIKQLIWDGSKTKQQINAEKINTQLKQQNMEVELYKIRETINMLYFNQIFMEKQIEILNIAKSNIELNLKKLESSYKYGVTLKSNVQSLLAELLVTRQKLEELKSMKTANLDMLRRYTGFQISEETEFVIPQIPLYEGVMITRPELKTFDLNHQYILQNRKLLNATKMPVLAGFWQFGYGKPGLNMLSDELDSYYILGITFNWNLWDWNKIKNDKQILKINSDIIQTQQEAFEQTIEILTIKERSEIEKLEKLIIIDNEIILLRTDIRNTAESQLENGVITSSEYIKELNNETQAKLNLELHKMQLESAKINLLQILGQY